MKLNLVNSFAKETYTNIKWYNNSKKFKPKN